MYNKNKLLSKLPNVDGLKTGHTAESGYGLVASAVAGRQRLIVVVNGLSNPNDRAGEARKLLEWGFRAFRNITLFAEDGVVGQAKVFGGTTSWVDLKLSEPLNVLVHRSSREPLKARAYYNGPLVAPVAAGTEVGKVKIWQGDRLIREAPVFTGADIGEGELHQRALDAVGELLFGWL